MSPHNTVSNASYSTAFLTALYAFLDHFTHDEWYAIGIATGALCSIVTVVANIYFRRQRNLILKQVAKKNADADED
ncbi:lysis protein [Salmonella enterica]|nr:lysis protein [Salmonella enterica]